MGDTLTLEERETIISYDQSPADAVVFTYDKALQSHFRELGVQPEPGNNHHGARTYIVPKKWLRFPRPRRKATAKQRQAALRNLGRTQERPNQGKSVPAPGTSGASTRRRGGKHAPPTAGAGSRRRNG